MRVFEPSAAFIAFFDSVIATAEAPVTPGTYAPALPQLANSEEAAFVQDRLVPLITQINRMKASVTPAPVSPMSGDPWAYMGGAP